MFPLREAGDGFEDHERWLPPRKSVSRTRTLIFRPPQVKPDVSGPKLHMAPSRELEKLSCSWNNKSDLKACTAESGAGTKIMPTIEHHLSAVVAPNRIDSVPRPVPTAVSDEDDDNEDVNAWTMSESHRSASSLNFRPGSEDDMLEDDPVSLVRDSNLLFPQWHEPGSVCQA